MLIKDLDGGKNLRGIKFLHPKTGETIIWWSQWDRGIWYKRVGEEDPNRIFPLTVDKLEDALEFEVVE